MGKYIYNGKRKNCKEPTFSPFPTMFTTLSIHVNLSTSNFSPAIGRFAPNLDMLEILSYCNRVKDVMMIATLFQDFIATGGGNDVWEKKKNFSGKLGSNPLNCAVEFLVGFLSSLGLPVCEVEC